MTTLTWAPQVAMTPEEVDAFLAEKLVARLTSIRPDGYPHATPLWYVWDGEALWFLLGAGARRRQHIRNLRRNPKLCVIIDRDARPEEGGLLNAQGVSIRGRAELSTGEELQLDVGRKTMQKYFGHVDEALVLGSLEDGVPGMNRVVVKVVPETVHAWDFRKLEGMGVYGAGT